MNSFIKSIGTYLPDGEAAKIIKEVNAGEVVHPKCSSKMFEVTKYDRKKQNRGLFHPWEVELLRKAGQGKDYLTKSFQDLKRQTKEWQEILAG